MRVQVPLLILLSFILLSSMVSLPPVGATSNYQIYYRISGDPRPGSEFVLQLAMSKADDQVRPIGNTVFNITVEGEAKPIMVKADETGVAEIRLKVPLNLVLGGVLRIHVKAYSDFYAASAERLIEIGVNPDYYGLACLALGSLSVLIPIFVVAGRRWKA